MRCPHCELQNEDGAAFCERCGTPLTAYGGQITGEVSEATRAKAAKLTVRPQIVPIMAAFCALLALVGPVWSLVARITTRPTMNAEGTNYAGAAFGAVGIAFAAMVLVPVALALLVVASGILTQRTWAWGAAAVVLAAGVLAALGGYLGIGLLKFVVLIGAVALAALWFRKDAREWYGVG
jgi:hypothetical protein